MTHEPLHGERVRLTAVDAADAEVVWSWYQDHEFSVLDGNIYGSSLQTTAEFLRTLQSPSFADASFGIQDEAGRLIGLVRLKRADPVERSADFGIAITREHWNQGYGSDATRTALRFAFYEMGLHRVALGVVEDNARARRVYEKCGFREEGREREAKYRVGRYVDRIVMSILEPEFRAVQPDDVADDAHG
jgi:RimJ/RimL family protein N-acetyltransferase